MGKPAKESRGWRGESLGVFSRVEKWAQDRALREGPNALVVYVGLCRLEFEAPSKYKSAFLASSRDIAAVTGLGTRTVQTYLSRLETCGLISIESGKKGKGGYSKNRITLIAAPPERNEKEALRKSCETNLNQERAADNSKTHPPSGGVRNNDSVALASASAPKGATRSGSTEQKTEESIINWE